MSAAQGIHGVLHPAGPQASAIYQLWLVMLWSSVVVFLVVIGFAVAALTHGMRRGPEPVPVGGEKELARHVSTAVGITVVVLFTLLAESVWTGRQTSSLQTSTAVTIALTGHQWWWEVEYEDALPARRVVTANELHIPTVRPVVLKVTSRDVIHSFWVPNLQGKRDLIPGYTTAIWLAADQPGVFRGRCAEFCGLQHAHMAFDIVAEPEQEFERWLERVRQPARRPENVIAQHGQEVFMTARCAGCHTIRGTAAHGGIAPDLTHLAARGTLGAGTLPNTPAHLGEWVLNPQASKPGNQMPANPLPADDLAALLSYLGSLQ